MANYLLVSIAFLIAVCLARVIIPQIILTAWKKKLFDEPDER